MRRIPLFALVLVALIMGGGTALLAQQLQSGLRGPVPVDQEGQAPRMTPTRNTLEKDVRAYPEQPPTIPHSIDGYQLSVNTNRCMSCHKREYTQGSGAPMISITHFQTRDGQMLADISPRRYFCTECHVPQANVRPLVENRFRDMSELGFKPAGSE